METPRNPQPLPPPPGVIQALKAGLDAISAHLSVLLLPLALDTLLWFGPRLSVKEIFLEAYSRSVDSYIRYGLATEAQIEEMKTVQKALADFFQRFNIIGFLRTFPVGVSSLMQGKMPLQTPFGPTAVFEVPSWLSLAGWVFLLVLIGWVAGGLYFHWVSTLIVPREKALNPARSVLQTLLLCAVFVLFAFLLGVPAFLLLALVNHINPTLLQAAIFVLVLFGSWIMVPVFFAPHGLYLHGQNAFYSIYSSLRLARFTLPSSSMFVLAVFAISYGLNYLWNVPPDDSWMTLIGIAGHAFVTTTLLAASFVYYRDMNAWLVVAFERLKPGTAAPQA